MTDLVALGILVIALAAGLLLIAGAAACKEADDEPRLRGRRRDCPGAAGVQQVVARESR